MNHHYNSMFLPPFPLCHRCCVPPPIDIQGEKTHQQLLDGVSHFHKEKLHHTETAEHVILPDSNSE